MTDDVLPETPDEALMSRIAQGDAGAFAELFRRRRGDVYRFALHMTAAPATAEDVTQDVFLAVMRDAGRFDAQRGTVSAWLCGMARNLVRRRLASDRGHQSLAAEAGNVPDLPSVHQDPVTKLSDAQRIRRMKRAILSLPVRYREAVVLCELQELTYAEAAAVLGCAIGTVRSRLHRGRQLLSAKLEATESSGGLRTGAGPRRKRCFA